jgi:fatty acid desaturase
MRPDPLDAYAETEMPAEMAGQIWPCALAVAGAIAALAAIGWLIAGFLS